KGMVIVCGDGGDLRVRHGNFRIERGKFPMLLVLLGTVVPARKRENQRIIALQFAELALFAGVIGHLVIGENSAGHNIRTHGLTPLVRASWASSIATAF